MNPHSHPHVEPTSVAGVREGGRSLIGSCFTFGTFFRKAQPSFKRLPRHSLPNQGLPETTDNPHLRHVGNTTNYHCQLGDASWSPRNLHICSFLGAEILHALSQAESLAGQGLALGPFLSLQCCSERGVSSNTSFGCNTELPGALSHCKLSIVHFFLPRCSFSL